MQDSEAINTYLKIHEDMFIQSDMNKLRERLVNCTDSQWNSVRFLNLKDPRSLLLISVFVGIYGVDRFMLGRKGSGIMKLLVCQLAIIAGVASFFLLLMDVDEYVEYGIFCLVLFLLGEIWWIIDICLIRRWTKDYNFKLISHLLNL